jgi:hypothetical protein
VSPVEYVMVTHVPVAQGGCALIPTADLADRDRYAWWSRVWFHDGIFENHDWRDLGRRLYAEERAACACGDVSVAAKLVAAFPQAFEFVEVRDLLQRLAWRYDSGGIREFAKAVAQVNPFRTFLSQRSSEARDVLAQGLGMTLFDPHVSVDAAFGAATGERVVEGGMTRRLRAHYERLQARRRTTFPKAIRASERCFQHEGRFAEFQVPAENAPRLILTMREDRAGATSVIPVDEMSWPRPEVRDPRPSFEPPRPTLQKTSVPRHRSSTHGPTRRRRSRT